jgi:hypothetical protein
VELGAREQDETTRRTDDAHLGVEVEPLLGAGLLAGVLSTWRAAWARWFAVPLVEVELVRAVRHRPIPVLREERHRALGLERVER